MLFSMKIKMICWRFDVCGGGELKEIFFVQNGFFANHAICVVSLVPLDADCDLFLRRAYPASTAVDPGAELKLTLLTNPALHFLPVFVRLFDHGQL